LARRSSFRNAVEAAVVRSLLGLLRRLPRQPGFATASFVIDILDSAVPRLRQVAMKNLSFALPDLNEEAHSRLVDDCFHSLARLVATLARFPDITHANVGEWIRYEGFEHFEEAKRRGKGVLFATAHLGNWEFSAFAHALLSEPMSFVVRPLDNPLLDALATRYRTLSGNRLLGRNDFIRPLLAALRSNEAVGILIDQNVAASEGVFVDFFGRQACVDPGFARLAARTGATVIPGYAVWSAAENKFVLTFDAPVPMTGDALSDTQAIHSALEQAIRRHPGQWLWIHRRWKTRPDGEAGLY
jgi:KDO2-lipid IV(A) lauroyltransferase